MLKLKLQYFATWCEELTHLEKPRFWERLKVGEGDNRLSDVWRADAITDKMDMSLNKLQEFVTDREHLHAVVHGVTKSWTQLSNWTELD